MAWKREPVLLFLTLAFITRNLSNIFNKNSLVWLPPIWLSPGALPFSPKTDALFALRLHLAGRGCAVHKAVLLGEPSGQASLLGASPCPLATFLISQGVRPTIGGCALGIYATGVRNRTLKKPSLQKVRNQFLLVCIAVRIGEEGLLLTTFSVPIYCCTCASTFMLLLFQDRGDPWAVYRCIF